VQIWKQARQISSGPFVVKLQLTLSGGQHCHITATTLSTDITFQANNIQSKLVLQITCPESPPDFNVNLCILLGGVCFRVRRGILIVF